MTELDVLQLMLQLIVTIFVALWSIYQTRATKKLEQEIHHLNTGLDQSIQLLHRAREAVIQINKAQVFLLQFTLLEQELSEIYLRKHAELSAYRAELRGLAFAINDEELLRLVNEEGRYLNPTTEERDFSYEEAVVRGKSQKLHTRISQLLEATSNINIT